VPLVMLEQIINKKLPVRCFAGRSMLAFVAASFVDVFYGATTAKNCWETDNTFSDFSVSISTTFAKG
jgi:hypothetical protein